MTDDSGRATEERKNLLKRILIALLIRPPIILILLPLCLFLLSRGETQESTVEERFGLSSSIKSPYKARHKWNGFGANCGTINSRFFS